MNERRASDLPDVDTLIRLIDSIFADINIGLLVYHVEEPSDIASARLVYVNQEASQYTGADLRTLVGKPIFEAFPALVGSDVPVLYAEVLRTKTPRQLGTVEYGDEHLAKQFYAVKAFPMPNDCLGVAFENITLRKRVQEMVRSQTQHLAERHEKLEKTVAATARDLSEALQLLQAEGEALRAAADRLTGEERERLERITATSKQMAQRLAALAAQAVHA